MTRRDWVAKHMPNYITNECIGGVHGCPGVDVYSDMPGFNHELQARYSCNHDCESCWDTPLPGEEPSTANVDNVNHPAHYELPGGIECFDVLLATQGLEAVKSFCICNAVKYLFRRNRKNGDEDVKKAAWYVAKYIELAKEVDSNVDQRQ